MKTIFTIIKIALAIALLNAVARFGLVAWGHFNLKDSAQQIVLFGAQQTPGTLQASVYGKAVELGVPLTEEQIAVTRQGPRTFINVAYTWPVEWFPKQVHPLQLSFMVEGFVPGAPGSPGSAPEKR